MSHKLDLQSKSDYPRTFQTTCECVFSFPPEYDLDLDLDLGVIKLYISTRNKFLGQCI